MQCKLASVSARKTDSVISSSSRRGLQQAVAHRVTEGIVDVLEQVEIDAEHGDTLVAGLAAFQRLAKPVLIIIAVRKVGRAVTTTSSPPP